MGKQKDFTYTKNRKAKGNMKLERNSVNREKRLSDSSSRQKAIMTNNGAQNKKLEEYSKEELIELVKTLKKRKKYGLVWEAKPEDVVEQCKRELPVLEEVKNRAIEKIEGQPTNLIIEGDNYHALSVLNYTHAGKVDVIYIDPPYNTGARDWKYNNDYVDANDTYRHSKWISMMHSRLLAAKNLLKSDGVLVVTIDDWESHNLQLLLEELFPERELTTVVIEHNPKGSPSRNFTYSHEYAHFMIPRGMSVVGKDPTEKEDTRNLRRAGRASMRKERPTMFYPIYVKGGKVVRIGTPPKRSFHPKGRNTIEKNGEIAVWPIDENGKERRWHFGLDSIHDHMDRIEVKKTSSGEIQLYVTAIPGRYKTVWTGGELDAGKYGTSLVREILGIEFPFPKSVYATAKCIETIVFNRPNALILDFFSGSGTTGHSTLLLNKKFGGNRQFILCTNNESNIAEDITYPRIKKVIEGVKTLPELTGIPANVRYFKTTFVPKDVVSDDTRKALVARSTEMICVRENTFEKKYDNKQYKIYTNGKIATGILFDLDAIKDFKKKITTLRIPAHLYVFSLTNDVFAEDFADLPMKHKLCPIPESILAVYRKLFA